MRRVGVLLLAAAPALWVASASCGGREPPPAGGEKKHPGAGKPLTFLDDKSGVLLYVESDRQHVAALGKEGKVLWHRNVVAEEGVKHPRADVKPAVVHVGKPLAWMLKHMKGKGAGPYVAVSFNNKSFGLLDQRTGKYTLMGSD